MVTSQKGIDLIKHYEGFRDKKYLCPAGLPTIGYGHVIRATDKYLNDAVLTEIQAEQILAGDLHFFEEQVFKMVGNIAQYQFDALVSFAYNLGPQALRNSTLLKTIISKGDPSLIESQFNKWSYCNGEIVTGLQMRRNSEAILFNTGQIKFFN